MTNSKSQSTQLIEDWMLANIKRRGYERFEELHVDRINSDWKAPDSWNEAGFEAFRLALDAKSRLGLDFVLVLTFGLKSGKTPIGRNFRTPAEFQAQLDSTPPALYLFQKGMEPWTEIGRLNAGATVEKIDSRSLGPGAGSNLCFYIDFRPADLEDYSRTVLVAG